MKIESGSVDKYLYFLAVDATDFSTPETGLSSFTVYRSRNGAAASVMTTPTINETDSSNMAGVYELLLDEDTTLAAGNDYEEQVYHISHAGMAPVTRTVVIERPKGTAGETITVGSGIASADVVEVSGDSIAADNLEAMYDATGYTDDTAPASRSQVDNIGAASGGAINYAASEDNTGGAIDPSSAAFVGSVQGGTYESIEAQDGTIHDVDDTGDDIDIVYGFALGGGRTATSTLIYANVQGNTDEVKVKAYDHVGAGWDIIGTLEGSGGGSYKSLDLPLFAKHTGTSGELGKVYIRFETDSTTPSTLEVDLCLVRGVIANQTVGYADGAIWVDTAGVAGSEDFINGTADNPCPWANALTINASLGLNRFHIANDNTITLAATFEDKTIYGEHYYLALGGQSINDSHIKRATITGIGSATDHAVFEDCEIGAATIPPCVMYRCGIGLASGTFTAPSGGGEYVFIQCFSMVPGSGTPTFDFSPVTTTTGINNRAWTGGAAYTLDTNCTLSHEVLAGGGTTVTPADANVEIRGLCRAITIALSDTDVGNTVQVIANTGPVTITASGSSDSATINLYGTSASVTDGSNGTTNDYMVSLLSINAEADTAISDYDPPTKAEMDTGLGLLATEAKQDTIDTVVDAIKVVTDALTSAAAAKLALSAGTIVTGAAAAGTLSTVAMTTNLTEVTNDHYNGRVIIWTSGVLANQAIGITDYDGASKMLTFTAVTEAPSDSDAFVII